MKNQMGRHSEHLKETGIVEIAGSQRVARLTALTVAKLAGIAAGRANVIARRVAL